MNTKHYLRLVLAGKTILILESPDKSKLQILQKQLGFQKGLETDYGNDNDGFKQFAVTKAQFKNRVKI